LSHDFIPVQKKNSQLNTQVKKRDSLKNCAASMFVRENTGNIKDFYKISTCIGKGSFGEVRKCLLKETSIIRAVKMINKKHLVEEELDQL